MAKIVGLVQLKGGTGRSTTATNLAVSLSQQGPTLLIDCDMPQGTAASWFAVREIQSDSLALETASTYRELADHIKGLAGNYEYIVLDAPPRIAEVTRAILMLSDLMVIPLGTSGAEIWAISDLMETLEEAKQQNPDMDARIMWNRYRGYTKSAREWSETVGKELGLAELDTKLGLRVAYSEALSGGLSVLEWTDKTAKEEMQALGNEIIEILRGKS